MIIFPLERVWKPHGLDWFFLSRWILSVFVPGQKPGSQQVFHTIPIPSLDKGTADYRVFGNNVFIVYHLKSGFAWKNISEETFFIENHR